MANMALKLLLLFGPLPLISLSGLNEISQALSLDPRRPVRWWYRLVDRALGEGHLCFVSDSLFPLSTAHLICHPGPDMNKVASSRAFEELCQGQCPRQFYSMALTPNLHFQNSDHLLSVQFISRLLLSSSLWPFPTSISLDGRVTEELGKKAVEWVPALSVMW